MFIAVDLKVVEGLAAAVGRAGGMSEDAVLAGLVRLWHRCWADEIDTLTTREVSGVFSYENGEQRALDALVAFGFLEAAGKCWRVKGAARYLKLKESRRRGAAATNAARTKRARSRATHNHALERSSATHNDALTPSHPVTQSPNTEEKLSPPARSRVLSDRLVATFLEVRKTPYRFASTVDGPALARLLKLPVTDDEVDRRWRIGLRGKFKQEANTIAQLDSKWNDLAKPDTPDGERRDEPRVYAEGRVRL